jgi:copper transport outer membrane protein MctB
VISFRYLIVTIVAIFLALGLGVLAGTTVLNHGIVATYKRQTHSLESQRAQLQSQLNTLNAFLSLAVPRMVEGRLAHHDIVLVTDDNADGSAVAEARQFLSNAGATVVAELAVTSRLGSDDPRGSGLTKLLGVSGTPAFVAEAAARKLADRLEAGPPAARPAPDLPRASDLLKGLLDEGFLLPHGAPDLTQVGGTDQSVVVVAGGKGEPAVPFSTFALPFVEQLVRDGVPIVAGQPPRARRGFIGLLRKDPQVSGGQGMVTVDDLGGDAPFGGVALVLGLKDLLATGQGGDYGLDAPSLIPGVP